MLVKLVQTCSACPEQYDAYIDGEYVAYLRLRYWHFTVHYKNDVVNRYCYSADTEGGGAFEEHERSKHLNRAACAIIGRHCTERDMSCEVMMENYTCVMRTQTIRSIQCRI